MPIPRQFSFLGESGKLKPLPRVSGAREFLGVFCARFEVNLKFLFNEIFFFEITGQPMTLAQKEAARRSKKPVPDEKKDETYWKRRHKNNMAAKRSREARRMKETDLSKRASVLEMEHDQLK